MWRKEILTVFSLLMVFVLAFSCGTQKNASEVAVEEEPEGIPETTAVPLLAPKKVHFKFEELNPHCGGAAPMPGVEYPTVDPVVGDSFLIYSMNENNERVKVMGLIVTDDNGEFDFRLQPGKYQVVITEKALTLERFIRRMKPDLGPNYDYANDACFQDWYKKGLLTFEMDSDTSFLIQRNNRCFVGTHPCMQYQGPTPP